MFCGQNNSGAKALRFSIDPNRTAAPLSAATFFVFSAAAARAGLVATRAGTGPAATGLWPEHPLIRTNLASTDAIGDVLQLIPGVPYQLLPAGTQPTHVTSPMISVKAMFQAIPLAKVQAVTCHVGRVAAGFPAAEVIIKGCGQGFFPRHIRNIAEFQVFSNEKITWINIAIVFYHEVLTAIIS